MEARATVIIPTFGRAQFARWAINSVQRQTVKDIEICILCDGSPESMVSFFDSFAKEDPRIRVFAFQKSPRTGEPYRDIAIKQTTGKIICYCCHDDLWLPNHVEEMEKTLAQHCFTNALFVLSKPTDSLKLKNLKGILADIQNPEIRNNILNGQGNFGLTCGAHTRKSYLELEEGWVTTPEGIPTDTFMWRKFISAYSNRCKTTMKVTAVSFPQTRRKSWSEQERDDELRRCFEKIQDGTLQRELADSYHVYKSAGDPATPLQTFSIRHYGFLQKFIFQHLSCRRQK